ncbi:pyruvate formate-lyase-activating protein [Anaerorhabdus sp.]|jgi:pyruvate formate lyase activating enzyme|uniref:pyruvate formate-lyase-activating protein n=1 Tax=Anaerorhabdus sp. TaxID=1872524 RepID=UPI002FCAA5F0
MIGRINSFHSFSTSDGPGIRAVIFMQGCPLRCKCCHNPETWAMQGGKEMSVNDLLNKISRGLSYYKTGGVTCSGGEAILQAPFVSELFKRCHEELNLHTTLDTSGCVLNDDVKDLLKNTDLVLLDIKMTTEAKYQDFAKGSLNQTLRFLDYLEENKIKTWIRHVVIPTVNDTEEETKALKILLQNYTCIEKVDFLPFRSLCDSKYEELNIDFPYIDIKDATDKDIERIEQWYK